MTIKKAAVLILAVAGFFLFASCKQTSRKVFLLVTIDTLRADHAGCYGYPRGATPFLDELAEKGVRFASAVTPLPITCGGHATILTSLHPVTHRLLTNGNDSLHENVETIAEVFQKAGYFTAGAVGSKLLSRQYGFHQGFDSFADDYDGWERDAFAVNRDAQKRILEWLKSPESQNRPLFLWIHYYDVHAPYLPHNYSFSAPVPERFNLTGEKNDYFFSMIDRYDQELRYVDEALEEMVDFLGANGMGGELTVCAVSDHGEQHMEHGFRHQHCEFYSETIQVPLVICGPSVEKGRVVNHPVSTVDIAQTLLDLAGLKFSRKTDGYNLFNAPSRNREMLITGHPYDHFSLQMFRYPFAYVRNHDQYYARWFRSDNEVIPPDRMLPAAEKDVKRETLQKEKVTFYFPDGFQQGVHWAAASMKLNIPEGASAALWMSFNQRLFNKLTLTPRDRFITVVQPVTTLGRYQLKMEIYMNPGVSVSDIRYTFLAPEEFNGVAERLTPMESGLFKNMRTLRKTRPVDEFYDLREDPGMLRDLLAQPGKAAPVETEEYRALIPRWFEIYWSRGNALLGERPKSGMMSDQQVNMLKSLGYL